MLFACCQDDNREAAAVLDLYHNIYVNRNLHRKILLLGAGHAALHVDLRVESKSTAWGWTRCTGWLVVGGAPSNESHASAAASRCDCEARPRLL